MKVSIIIPYYNADKWIGRMLASLLKQDLSSDDYEIIVVDDGSTNEPHVLMDYVQRHPNVLYIHQENAGPGAARNTGIEHAKGDYVFFCDSDDFVGENVLGRLYEVAHCRDLEMLFFNVPRVTFDESVINPRMNFTSVDEYPSGQEFFAQPIDKFISMGVWQFLISRSFVDSHHLRFPPDMIMNEDACFFMDAILVSQKTAKVDVDAYYYVYNPQSSIHFSGKVLQAEKWTNNILLFISKLNEIIRDKELVQNMPVECFNNLKWLRNHKAYIVLTEGCRYLDSKRFRKVLKRLVDMDSYPKPFGTRIIKKRIILNKGIIRLLNVIYGHKRSKISVSLLFTFLMIMSSMSCGASDVNDSIPSYFVEQIEQKIGEIEKMSKQGASFVFITDTHVRTNEMHSPQLIKYVLDNSSIHTVIWGGDAVNPKELDIDEQWKIQLRFDSVLNKSCHLYKVRGNHDFSVVKNIKYPKGLSYSNEKAAELLLKNCPSNIHRNIIDPGACYYFFDDTSNKVRYIVLDTTDSVPSRDNGYGNVPFVHNSQLQWIADSAVSTTPHEYGLVFISHIPISDKMINKRYTDLWKLSQFLKDINSHSSGRIGNVKYDFTKLDEVKILMCIAGHIHEDSGKYVDGILHLTTDNDGKWQEETVNKNARVPKRKERSVSEQCFDCLCISNDKTIVHAYRIGFGSDRHYHLTPVNLSVNKIINLKSMLKGPVKWTNLNAIGNKKDLSNEILLINNKGIVKGIAKGNAKVVARDKFGNREFFNVIVQ